MCTHKGTHKILDNAHIFPWGKNDRSHYIAVGEGKDQFFTQIMSGRIKSGYTFLERIV